MSETDLKKDPNTIGLHIIAIEGLDASGKTTQAKLLSDDLKQRGLRVSELSFPRYDSFFGERIGMLLSGRELVTAETLDPRSMALWFAMDRWDAMRSSKSEGREQWSHADVLILNRWTLSNAVYQGARTLSDVEADDVFDWVLELEFNLLGLPKPTTTVLLDIDVTTSMQRATDRAALTGDRPDVYESRSALLHASKRLYQRAAAHGHGTIINVDNQTPAAVHSAVLALVNAGLT